MDIAICKALPENANDYADCVISCWQSAYKGIVSDEYLKNMLAEKKQRVEKYKSIFIAPGDCEYFCVMQSERMIGFLIIQKNRDEFRIGEIWAIYLIEEFWGKGYGTKLLDFALAELKHAGKKNVFLWVFEENKKARRFYEKHGFCFDGTKREVDKYGCISLVQLRYSFNCLMRMVIK